MPGDNGNAHTIEAAARLYGFRGVRIAGDEFTHLANACLILFELEERHALVQARHRDLLVIREADRKRVV